MFSLCPSWNIPRLPRHLLSVLMLLSFFLLYLSISPAPGSLPDLLLYPDMLSYYLWWDTAAFSLPEIPDKIQYFSNRFSISDFCLQFLSGHGYLIQFCTFVGDHTCLFLEFQILYFSDPQGFTQCSKVMMSGGIVYIGLYDAPVFQKSYFFKRIQDLLSVLNF